MRLLILLVALATAASAQTPGACETGRATAMLDVSDARPKLTTTGSAEFEVPGLFHVSDFNLWVSGNVDGDERVSGVTYWSHRRDSLAFWPGPLDPGARLPSPTDCSRYDRIWTISVDDLAAFDAGGAPAPDLAEWPIGLGAPAVDASGAPVQATNRDQTIDLGGGERPIVYGSQTAFWVMNDVGNAHRPAGSAALGVEVAVTVFAIASRDFALDRTAVYRYRVTNRNTDPIDDLRLSLYAFPLVGESWNDFVGADTTRSMAFAYDAAIEHTHDTPNRFDFRVSPASGFDILGGSDGQATLASFVSHDDLYRTYVPVGASEMYHSARGRWIDGTPITEGGSGYGSSGDITTVAFSGDPVTGEFWSYENTGGREGHPYSRQMAISTGPASLAPGESRTVDVGVLTALGTDRLDSITRLRAVSDRVQGMYDDGSLFAMAAIPAPRPLEVAPTLVSPSSADGPFAETVTFEWTAVPMVAEYELEVSDSPSFDEPRRIRVATTTFADIPQARPGTVYWRVRGLDARAASPFSATRSFEYQGARSVLNRVLGVVEAVGPGGADPCGASAQSRWGCPDSGQPHSVFSPGNSILGSYNGTGEYLMYDTGRGGSAAFNGSLRNFGSNDFEIRFVGLDEGSYAWHGFRGGRVVRVPFQVWDIGRVEPGEVNDPSNDARLIPLLFAGEESDATIDCTFEFNASGLVQSWWPSYATAGLPTPQIYAYYPADDYAAWEAAAAPLAERCTDPTPPSSSILISIIDIDRGRPIERDLLLPATASFTVADMDGVVIRYYTNDNFRLPTEGTVDAEVARLGDPFPNPARRSASIPYETSASGRVRLSVVDLLGREVAVLVDDERTGGEHVVRFDTSGLAVGLYVVVLQTSDARASRLLTVTR